MSRIAQYRKLIAAVFAALGSLVAAGLITGQAAVWIAGLATALAVGLATYSSPPNATPELTGGSTHPGR